MFQATQQNLERMKLIATALESVPDGEVVEWLKLEEATGIPMRSPPYKGIDGRGLTRRVLKKMKRQVERIVGVGFRLSAPDNSERIMYGRVRAVARGAKRAKEAGDNLVDRHGKEMTPSTRGRIVATAAVMSTLVATARGGQKGLLPAPANKPSNNSATLRTLLGK